MVTIDLAGHSAPFFTPPHSKKTNYIVLQTTPRSPLDAGVLILSKILLSDLARRIHPALCSSPKRNKQDFLLRTNIWFAFGQHII